MNVFTSTLATLFLLASLAQAYPSGAPKCTSLTPKHTGAKAKTSKSPYKIEATKANKDSAVVTISGGSGDKFKGFLLYATKPGSEDKIGTFKKVEKTSVMKCGSAVSTCFKLLVQPLTFPLLHLGHGHSYGQFGQDQCQLDLDGTRQVLRAS